jgi:hypothetical protein
MDQIYTIKAEYFTDGTKAVDLKIVGDEIKIISMQKQNSKPNKGVPFKIFEKFCNKKAIDSDKSEEGFGEIKFIEIEGLWLYPSFTPLQFSEIAPKNTFHPSVLVEDLWISNNRKSCKKVSHPVKVNLKK